MDAQNQNVAKTILAPASMSMADVIAGVQKSLGVTNDPLNIQFINNVDIVLS